MLDQTRRGFGMSMILSVFAFLNLIFIVSYIIGQYFIFEKSKNPKLVAYFALYVAVLMGLYLLMLLFLMPVALIKQNFLVLPLFIAFIMTFVIGRWASYARLKMYTNMQLLTLFFSLFYSLLLLIKAY